MNSQDRAFLWTLRAAGGLSAAIVVFIAGFLVFESIPALSHVGLARFFTDGSWHPRPLAGEGQFSLLPMLNATLLATLAATLAAGPLGVLSAVFCRFYAPRALATVYRRLIELLAGIPSVVYGLWGLVVLAPLIRQLAPPGQSLLAGIAILTLMILPTTALLAEAALSAVPRPYFTAAAALGLSRGATVLRVALPAARAGLFTGVLLAAARAIGETMAVLMVCGNVVQTPASLFDPVRTLTANIALEMDYALGDHRSALFVSGLLLLAMVTVLVVVAHGLSRGRTHG